MRDLTNVRTCFCVGDCSAPKRQQRYGSQQDGDARPAAHSDGCPGLPRLHRWLIISSARPPAHCTAHARYPAKKILICLTSAIQGRFLKVGKSVRAAPILDLRLGRLWEERRASAGE
jgi:hypothetical protein